MRGDSWGGKTLELVGGGRVQLVPSLLAQMAAYEQPGSPEFSLVLETLESIHSLSARHQTHCLILFLPSKEEVYLPLTGVEAAAESPPLSRPLQKKINFTATRKRHTPTPPGWEAYDGSVYTSERGYGWLTDLREDGLTEGEGWIPSES